MPLQAAVGICSVCQDDPGPTTLTIEPFSADTVCVHMPPQRASFTRLQEILISFDPISLLHVGIRVWSV